MSTFSDCSPSSTPTWRSPTWNHRGVGEWCAPSSTATGRRNRLQREGRGSRLCAASSPGWWAKGSCARTRPKTSDHRRLKRKARDVLSREDLDALVAAQPTLRDQAALTLLVWLGLRKDELRRLRLCDIDLQERTLVVHRKGGHLDKLPMGFEHVYNALALYMRDRGADEYLLHPERRPIAAMEASTVHRWFRGAQARRAFKRVGLARPSTCCRRCTARSHRRHRPRAATPAPLRHPNDPRLSKPQYGASCSRDAPG